MINGPTNSANQRKSYLSSVALGKLHEIVKEALLAGSFSAEGVEIRHPDELAAGMVAYWINHNEIELESN